MPNDDLRGAYGPQPFRSSGHALVDVLADYLEEVTSGGSGSPVIHWRRMEEMADRWRLGGASADLDLLGLTRRAIEDSLHQHHPGCLGYQVSPPLPAAALTELVSALLNNGMASYASGPAASAVEHAVVRWMCDRLDWSGGDGILTSGGSLGNLTALLAVRQLRAGGDVWEEGMGGSRPLAILVSAQSHYCVDRAVRIMGWGGDGIVTVPVDGRYRLRSSALGDALRRAERRGRRVIAVVASAGSTITGSIDPLEEVADFCEQRGLWMHVDAAHGASALLVDELGERLLGIERADSLVWDAHKMLAMPSLVTGLLYRRAEDSYAAFDQQAPYLFDDANGSPIDLDRGLRTIECTKGMIGLALYFALAQDSSMLRSYVERSFALAVELGECLAGAPDFELATPPETNIVCYRYLPQGCDEPDALQRRVRSKLIADGRFFVAETTLDGNRYLRSTLMNPLTTSSDLGGLIEAIREARES